MAGVRWQRRKKEEMRDRQRVLLSGQVMQAPGDSKDCFSHHQTRNLLDRVQRENSLCLLQDCF